ncbi:WD40 repeat domain-containing protein [Actinocatenispora rupis]|uniref:WD40 repeat n=1 Tax=Actinocatenispora rupis TaxID=519421 RepID=A0A8J3JF53_9ACTN|nr:hypothetical protein [Actinocatenispora rupis]GID15312.1 hypothetical protein Aru02nite_62010 [Actinocatenispora rupis]
MSTTTTDPDLVWQADIDDAPVSVSAAGGLVAVLGAEGACAILNADDGAPIATFTVDGGLHTEFSPDGARLAVTGPTGHAIWHAADRTLDRYETGTWSSVARWSRDGRVAVADGRRVVVRAGDGAELWRTDEAPSTLTDLTWFKGGREVAACAYNGVYRYAPHRRDPVGHFAYPGSHLAVAATSNSRWICTGNQDRSVHIWRARDGQELEMPGYPDKVTRLAFDRTDRWLANDGAPEITIWDFAGKGPSGTSPRLLRGHDVVTGHVEHVFYPIFPPNTHAQQVLAWLHDHPAT